MDRTEQLDRIRDREEPWDLLVVGGGATGVGTALDAAARGYAVALLERSDLGKGTSSRSTKLIHGGVRYLQQGNIALVIEALRERGRLRRNAPAFVHDLQFVVPNHSWWEAPFYGVGMKVYDVLAGRYGFGGSRLLSKAEVLEHIPTVEQEGLRGGVLYHDGQFDDAALLIALARTAVDAGAAIANYVEVVGLVRSGDGLLEGVEARDHESGDEFRVKARVVVNATGPFADGLRRMDEADAQPLIVPSQGVHLVLPRSFLPGDTAIMVPRTKDKRVLFAIPWKDHVLVGTTDTPVDTPSVEPKAFPEEIEFLLETSAGVFQRDPRPSDVLSCFAGIRPLARAGEGLDTAEISREHSLHVSRSGLLTVAGGKWTTYRKMAEDVVDHAAALAGLEGRRCPTRDLPIHDPAKEREALVASDPAFAAVVAEGMDLRVGDVVYAARHELARSVEDVLARRHRALLLDARRARAAAPAVARILAETLGRDDAWARTQRDAFGELARRYLLPGVS